jgi:two-component system chemotaxis response regulator CheB
MSKARILIVDDSTVIRRLVSDALSADSAIEVVGTAANGRIAVAKIAQLQPDLVTLDLEMPEMDGLATLAEIRKSHPRLPVIIFSTLTQKGAVATLQALSQGASDYVTKPAHVGSVMEAIATVRSELIPRIKALTHVAPRPAALIAQPIKAPPIAAGAARAQRPEIIAIGASTGGPNALAELFRQLPPDLPVPIAVVQHMPPLFTRYLAERLDGATSLAVREAAAHDALTKGSAWIAPGDFHMQLGRTSGQAVIRLDQGPPENCCRPSVDVLLRSVARDYGSKALAIILTGMGQDGLRGCEAIRAAGGRVIVQDEATSVVWGMPGTIARAGLADAVLPLSLIGPEIVRLVGQRRPPADAASLALAHA